MDILEALEFFRATQPVADHTMANYSSAVRSLTEHGLTDTKQLTRSNLATWVAARTKEDASPTTVNTQLAGILSICSTLERAGRFPLKRLEQIRRLRLRGVVTPEPYFLKREEVARLRLEAQAIHQKLDLAVAFAVFAGLRLNELRKLHAEDLCLEGETPYVKVLRIRGETKTKRSRAAPIAKAFAADLKRREFPAGPIFTPEHANNPQPYLSRETLRAWLAEARDRAGLYRCTWPVLRHCFASYLRQGGVELSLVSGFMGNTVRVAEKFYAAMGPGGNTAIEKGFAEPAA